MAAKEGANSNKWSYAMRGMTDFELFTISGGNGRNSPSPLQVIHLAGSSVLLGISCSPPGIAVTGGLGCFAAGMNFLGSAASILDN